MPTTYKIPAKTEHRCEPCEHHNLIGSLHVRCGGGGWREYTCTHPEAYNDRPLPSDPEKAELLIRLRLLIDKSGRHIGRTEDQPEWCPLKREA